MNSLNEHKMKFALVNGVRKTAEPKELGICICCNTEVRAYCGLERVHHWKHIQAIECDSWSEGETEWHRDWKNNFDSNQQEIVKFDPDSGEKHIADVYIESNDLVLEFQHSPIHIEEIKARESFYKRMIWVVDVLPYKENVSFHRDISDAFRKYVDSVWEEKHRQIAKLEKQGKFKEANDMVDDDEWYDYLMSLEKKYFPDYRRKSSKAETSRNLLKGIEEEMILNPNIQGYSFSEENINRLKNWGNDYLHPEYLLMIWKYKNKRWNHAELPLFFDIGDEFVYRSIENIKYGNGFLVKKYRKKRFVKRYKDREIK